MADQAEEPLVALLLADAGVKAKVANRVYWGEAPQGVGRPCVVLYRIGGQGLGDVMSGQDGLAYDLVQADCLGDRYADAATAARALIDALVAARGGALKAFVTAQRDLPYPAEAGQPTIFRRSVDLRVWATQS